MAETAQDSATGAVQKDATEVIASTALSGLSIEEPSQPSATPQEGVNRPQNLSRANNREQPLEQSADSHRKPSDEELADAPATISRNNTLHEHPVLLKLRDEFLDARVKGYGGEPFIPAGVLRSKMQHSQISDMIGEMTSQLKRNAEIRDRDAGLIPTGFEDQVHDAPEKSMVKLFAFLILLRRGGDIGTFVDKGVTDDDLPLRVQSLQQPSLSIPTTVSVPKSGIGSVYTKAGRLILPDWWSGQVQHFKVVQKYVMAPTITSNIDSETDLPLLPIVNSVPSGRKLERAIQWRARFHQDNYDLPGKNEQFHISYRVIVVADASPSLMFILKYVERFSKSTDDQHPQSTQILAQFQYLEQRHLVTFWAPKTLQEVWVGDKPLESRLSHEYLSWLAKQWNGLTHALARLPRKVPYSRNDEDGEIHLDLRLDPGQILWFARGSMGPGSEEALQLDIVSQYLRASEDSHEVVASRSSHRGSASSSHYLGSRTRYHSSKSESDVYASQSYSSRSRDQSYYSVEFASRSSQDPRAYLDSRSDVSSENPFRPSSRVYECPELYTSDYKFGKQNTSLTWSLGCIMLETVTWLLLGPNGVDTFRRKREENGANGRFYTSSLPGKADIRPVVKEWHRQLLGNPLLTHYLNDFLHLVQRMLIIYPASDRLSLSNLLQNLSVLQEKTAKDADYAARPMSRGLMSKLRVFNKKT